MIISSYKHEQIRAKVGTERLQTKRVMKIETEKIWKKRALKLLGINIDKHVLEICCK